MDFIFYFILLAILFRVVGYIFKSAGANQNNSTSYEPADSADDDFYDILGSIDGFSDDEIVESVTESYLFSIDRTSKQFIFILRDGTVYRYNFEKLVSYSVRKQENKTIAIDLKVRDINRPYIYINCFDTLKLYNEHPRQFSNVDELVDLYKEELENIDEIKKILDEILKENDRIAASAPMKEQPIITPIPEQRPKPKPVKTVLEVVETIKDVKEEKDTVVIEEVVEEPLIVETVTTIAPEKEVEQLYVPDYSYKPLQEEVVNAEPLIVSPPSPAIEEEKDDEGRTKTTIDEIEALSRGKFLDSAIQSAVSDAKMRGKKFIYLTDEQLDNLKNS